MQPNLETPRLLLLPRTLADTDDCLRLDRAPGVTEYITGPWDDPGRHQAFIESRTSGPYPDGQGYWTIRPKSGPDRFLGWMLLIPRDAEGPETEIGWRLLPDAQGQGYATEAALALLQHAFATLALPEVVADIHLHNQASTKVALKLNLRRIGPTPGEADHFRYAISSAAHPS